MIKLKVLDKELTVGEARELFLELSDIFKTNEETAQYVQWYPTPQPIWPSSTIRQGTRWEEL